MLACCLIYVSDYFWFHFHVNVFSIRLRTEMICTFRKAAQLKQSKFGVMFVHMKAGIKLSAVNLSRTRENI